MVDPLRLAVGEAYDSGVQRWPGVRASRIIAIRRANEADGPFVGRRQHRRRRALAKDHNEAGLR